MPEILSEKFALHRAGLVIANIIAPILEELFEEGLGKIVASEGQLVLSGVLENQLPAILDHLGRSGFEVKKFLRQGEWVAVLSEKITA